ncbi:hypothetical protein SSP531S_02380 [Streptomyces spongiicola]|uniref:Uncharacterized protein n=1 Tax=Streptomyces spongiicola TaxID=1690221 RepID=A0A388SQZ1_9ACTN|nr:hypothetical protein SSP531S_02380 [Streptomyces spongiicola]
MSGDTLLGERNQSVAQPLGRAPAVTPPAVRYRTDHVRAIDDKEEDHGGSVPQDRSAAGRTGDSPGVIVT